MHLLERSASDVGIGSSEPPPLDSDCVVVLVAESGTTEAAVDVPNVLGPSTPVVQKPSDLELQFTMTARPEAAFNASAEIPAEVDAANCFELRTDVRGFLQTPFGDAAAKAWGELLHRAFPEFARASVGLENMLVLLVLHRRTCLASTQARPFDFVEYWAGSGVLTKECVRLGLNCCRLDRVYSRDHDCSLASGVRLWLQVLCRVREGGAIWCGTQCSSFLLICLSKSKRRQDNGYFGDVQRQFVQDGNHQMIVTSLLAFVARLLFGLDFILEQPMQSVLPRMQPLRAVLEFLGAVKCSTWLGQFGGESPKPLRLCHTSRKFARLARKRPTVGLASGRLVTRLPGNRFRGASAALKRSQVYPQEFAVAVASLIAEQQCASVGGLATAQAAVQTN